MVKTEKVKRMIRDFPSLSHLYQFLSPRTRRQPKKRLNVEGPLEVNDPPPETVDQCIRHQCGNLNG